MEVKSKRRKWNKNRWRKRTRWRRGGPCGGQQEEVEQREKVEEKMSRWEEEGRERQGG